MMRRKPCQHCHGTGSARYYEIGDEGMGPEARPKLEHLCRCGDCGNWFDTRDARAFVPNWKPGNIEDFKDLESSCPACQQMSDAATAWALWNGCQGVFSCSVFNSRKEALDAKGDCEVFEKVVPVRVVVEYEWRWLDRDHCEAEAEKCRSVDANKKAPGTE